MIEYSYEKEIINRATTQLKLFKIFSKICINRFLSYVLLRLKRHKNGQSENLLKNTWIN